jgi:two-component system phosphate regulon sensor histidine kinase PhoR
MTDSWAPPHERAVHDLALCVSLLETLRDPALLIGPDTRLRALNSATRALLPVAREGDLLARALRAPDVLDAVGRILGGAEAEVVTWRERVPVERVSDVLVSPFMLSGLGRCAVVTLRDLTEARRLERMRVDFIANVSHELRTPLASMLGFIETLQGPAREDAAARARFLDIMGEQGRRMARLIDDLLSLSRIEQNEHLRPNTPVDIASVVGHVADALALLALDNRVTLQIDAPREILVLGDRDELVRLAENLIENAIKYGSLPDRDTTVDVSLAREGERVRFKVRDHGLGIPREHLPRLTERFYRVDAGASRSKGGTGLGLALVKHIVARHRGRLEISSQAGEGASFDVVFPAAN